MISILLFFYFLIVIRSQIEIYLDTEQYHQVIVGNNTQIIHFLPYQQYSTSFPPNVFVAWRYFVSLGLVNQDYYNHSVTRILWLHDLLEKSHLPGEISPLVVVDSID